MGAGSSDVPRSRYRCSRRAPASIRSVRANQSAQPVAADRIHKPEPPAAWVHPVGTMNTRYNFYDAAKCDRRMKCIAYAASVHETLKSALKNGALGPCRCRERKTLSRAWLSTLLATMIPTPRARSRRSRRPHVSVRAMVGWLFYMLPEKPNGESHIGTGLRHHRARSRSRAIRGVSMSPWMTTTAINTTSESRSKRRLIDRRSQSSCLALRERHFETADGLETVLWEAARRIQVACCVGKQTFVAKRPRSHRVRKWACTAVAAPLGPRARAMDPIVQRSTTPPAIHSLFHLVFG